MDFRGAEMQAAETADRLKDKNAEIARLVKERDAALANADHNYSLLMAERERCAKIIEGETFKEIYRTWPWWGSGNRANDSEMVKFCDAAAAAIREAK